MMTSPEMIILAISAAFVGLVHSLAPGHWLPVVLMAKSRKWSAKTAILGALVAASGHIFLSAAVGLAPFLVGAQFLTLAESEIERFAGIVLVVFGLAYAGLAYYRHAQCKGHTHHGPSPKGNKTPFAFLFTLGFSPCVAVLPVFAAAATEGSAATILTLSAFSFGVILALVGATLLVSLGLMKLDHPLFEHYGDVITGLGVSVMGVILFLVS